MQQLTIIVPTFNSKENLERCIHSFNFEENHEFEVLFCDYGSTDGTTETLLSFQRMYKEKIKLISDIKGGYSGAIKRGLEEADSEYVKIMKPSDWFLKSFIDKKIEEIKKNDEQPDIYINDVYLEYESVRKIERYEMTSLKQQQNKIFDLKEFYPMPRFVPLQAIIFKKSVLPDLTGIIPSELRYINITLAMMIINRSNTATYCSDKLHHYSIPTNSFVKKEFINTQSISQQSQALKLLINTTKYETSNKVYTKNALNALLYWRAYATSCSKISLKEKHDRHVEMVDYLEKNNPDLYDAIKLEAPIRTVRTLGGWTLGMFSKIRFRKLRKFWIFV